MDFRWTPAEAAFKEEVAALLRDTLTPEFWDYHRREELPEWSPRFSRAAAGRGMLGIAWPEIYGGRARGVIEQTIYMDELAFAGAPQEHHRRAVQQVGPSIMLAGSEELKRTYLPGISRAEISFAMGLSEPNAGSDLANVQTSATRDGDDYVLNGHKWFTSGAHYSDFLYTVARTDPAAPKHRGISMIIVPLRAPGVEVRPLIDLKGEHHFNEVLLRDVRVSAGQRVGEENRGWYINAQMMDLERSGGAHVGTLRRHLALALAAAKERRPGDSRQRAVLTECAIAVETARWLAYRVAWLRSKGAAPNYEVSMVKVLATETQQRIQNAAVNRGGLASLVCDSVYGAPNFGLAHLQAVSATIAQGSSEIQRNVIATRGLGLPRA